MRLLCSSLRLLAWLMATACLCGGISSDEHPAFVLTHLKEDATIIQIPFTTDTEVASNSKPNGYELTINGNIPGSGYNINGSQIDITDLSMLETGKNVLNLHYQVQSVNITKFFHLYMFTPPEINIDTESNTMILSCSLSKTGATSYRNWIVEFTKLDDNNQSIGLCIENVSNYSNLYYSESLEACILKIPYPIQQQDAGQYLCTLHIRHTDANFMRNLHSHPFEVKEMYLQYVIPSVLTGFLMLLLVGGIVSAAVVYKRKYHPPPHQPPQEIRPPVQTLLMDGAEDPFQNPFQDTPLRPQSCPPATDYLLRHKHPSYGLNKEFVGPVLQHKLESQFNSSSSTVPQGACFQTSSFTFSEGIQSDYSLSADDETTPEPTRKNKGIHSRKNSLVSAHQTWRGRGGEVGGEREIVSGRAKINDRKPATGVLSPSVPPRAQNSDDESGNESNCTLTPTSTPGFDEHTQRSPMSKNPSDKMRNPAVNAVLCADSIDEDSSKQSSQPTAASPLELPTFENTALSDSLTVDSASTSNSSPLSTEDDNSSNKPQVAADSSLELHKSINTATSGSSNTDSNASPSSTEDENSSKQHAAEAVSLQSYSIDTVTTRSPSSDMDSPRNYSLSTDGKNMPKPKPDSLAQKSVITDPKISSTSQFSPTETKCSISGQNVERENNYFSVGSSCDKPLVDGETRNERQLENRERKKKKTTTKKK